MTETPPARKPGPNTVAGHQPRSELGRWEPSDERNGLTAQQAAFAEEYIQNGGNASAAARVAGYAAGTEGPVGSRLVRLPWVQRAVEIARKRMLQRVGAKSLRVVLGILEDGQADPKLRLKAAEIGLKADRADRDAGKDSDGAGKRLNEMTVAELEALVRRLDSAAELAQLPILEHNEPSPHDESAQVIDPAGESTAS
jgi:hypothetical protein